MNDHWRQVELGKLPPQALESERIVLCSILVVNSIFELAGELKPEYFYKVEHQEIYKAALDLYTQNVGVDLQTVFSRLRERGKIEEVGGLAYVADLMNEAVGNYSYHSKVIREMHFKREGIALGNRLIQMGYNPTVDAFEMLAFADKSLTDQNVISVNKKPPTFSQQILQALREHQEADQAGGIVGIPVGIEPLAKVFSYVEGELIVIAGRPGMGKTAAMINDAIPLAYRGVPVAIYELEMNAKAFIDRTLGLVTGIPAYDLKRGKYMHKVDDLNLVQSQASKLMNLPIYLNDNPKWTVLELIADLRRIVKQMGIKVVYIDYLQLIELIDDKRSQKADQIGFVTRALKVAAKDLGITIIVFSQLSRKVEERPDKKPILSDLRDSGAIEQDADSVIFLYCPEYYKITHDKDGQETTNQLIFIIAKFREGKPQEIKARFNREFSEIIHWHMANFENDQLEVPF